MAADEQTGDNSYIEVKDIGLYICCAYGGGGLVMKKMLINKTQKGLHIGRCFMSAKIEKVL